MGHLGLLLPLRLCMQLVEMKKRKDITWIAHDQETGRKRIVRLAELGRRVASFMSKPYKGKHSIKAVCWVSPRLRVRDTSWCIGPAHASGYFLFYLHRFLLEDTLQHI
jgi:hypothetical protein